MELQMNERINKRTNGVKISLLVITTKNLMQNVMQSNFRFVKVIMLLDIIFDGFLQLVWFVCLLADMVLIGSIVIPANSDTDKG